MIHESKLSGRSRHLTETGNLQRHEEHTITNRNWLLRWYFRTKFENAPHVDSTKPFSRTNEQYKTLGYILQVLNSPDEVTILPSWPEVLSISQKEGLCFLLYKAMIKRDINIPSSLREKLKQAYIYNWGRNVRIFEDLAALLHSLESPVIILKGASLLPSVYENVGLRYLGDVDIFVKPADVPKIDKVLSQLGYRTPSQPCSFQVSNYLNSLLYRKNGSPLLLHLHWHLVNNALPNYIYAEKINTQKLWKDAIPLKIRQEDTLCLAPHHQLLHLSEHAMKHSYNTLIHVWDIHQVINHWKTELDWEKLYREAEEFHLKGPLFYSLWLGKKYFDLCVPQKILDSLRPHRRGMGEKFFFSLLKQGKRKEKVCWFFYFSAISSWQKRIKFVFRTLFPPINILSHMEGVKNGEQGSLCWKVVLRRLWKALRLFGKGRQEYND